MEKKDKKQRDIVLSQDNALTTARYKFDLIEKRALYSIIRNIRAQYIENENGRRDLFDDLIITIHEEELKKCGDNTKMQNIYDALKRLRNRDIEINNEKMWLSIGFVNYVKHADRFDIYLDEKKVQLKEDKTNPDIISYGFGEYRIIQDYPIRGRATYLHVRKRKWLDKSSNEIFSYDWNLSEFDGTRLNSEFVSFLKEGD